MDVDTLKQIKQDIIEGKISLRSAAVQYGIDRDKLKDMIEGEMTAQSESASFRERMKLNHASSTIELNKQIEDMVVSILKGNITAKQASEILHIDRETMRRKIGEFVQKDKKYLKLYFDYRKKSTIDYGKINFKGLIVYMLKQDMSQSEIADEYGIPARTISREVEKLKESNEENDQKLYNIAKICADRKMRRQKLSKYESELYGRMLGELFSDIPVIDFESESPLEMERDRLEEFCKQVEEYQSKNMPAEQIAQTMGVSISTIRRNKLKLQELKRQEEYKDKLQEGQPEGLDLM